MELKTEKIVEEEKRGEEEREIEEEEEEKLGEKEFREFGKRGGYSFL